ncbi:hypothetical protein ANO11243_072700 [Dothideomycetidae sp. 11243]|nr:hypothetical protein ANO11243_072700 [fungal sp. No.11243]
MDFVLVSAGWSLLMCSYADRSQDPEATLSGGPPAFLLRLQNEEDLTLQFNCTIRQAVCTGQQADGPHGSGATTPIADTSIAGLTFVFASTAKEIEQLMTREFHADPNIHKNPNVTFVGDFSTAGAPSIQVQYTWKWKPPKTVEDVGGGWRTTCCFVEYDQRAHKLNPLATFSIWVQNTPRPQSSPQLRSPRLDTISPQRLRVPSAQSIESRMSTISDSDGEQPNSMTAPQSPGIEPIPEYGLGLVPTSVSSIGATEKLDIGNVGRPAEDYVSTEDGPLFRATMKSLESKTGTMRTRMKRVLRTAEAAESAQVACNDAVSQFMDALREASTSNANAVRPALDHYFEKIAKEILSYERKNALDLRKLIIEPITRVYNIDIKQAESKRRDFEEESKDYYAYVGKYLGQRTESLKEKKRAESDSKYQSKRRTFELKRFDYSSFMHDLHGGRKDQEVLSQLTKYADAQTKSYMSVARKIEDMLPQLDALCLEVGQADKDFQMQRTEREEKRRALEKNPRASMLDPDAATQISAALAPVVGGRPDAAPYGSSPPTTSHAQMSSINGSVGAAMSDPVGIPSRNTSTKFKGIRDLEEKDVVEVSANSTQQIRKEGLLWSLSRPGAHIDPMGIKTAGWHKFWIVLDQGKLSEYVNWKDKLDLHMDPIDLRVASVREARNSERRFCFEVITPHFTRVYQAPSEDDMRSWIAAINNALQSAFEAKTVASSNISVSSSGGSTRSHIAAVLTGKSSSLSGHRNHMHHGIGPRGIHRHATTGDKPAFMRNDSNDPNPSEVLMRIREADEGNKYCADCGSESKTEWVSINLGIVLCIECSGIHRSLGTHISKIRSLTLDVAVFTQDIVDLLLLIGNRVSNMIWEARLDRALKPMPSSTREQRLNFITAKYVDRAFIEPIAVQSPDDLLLTSIKRNQIQSVLQALALKGSPNAQDRSRGTHAVYLALAAADPAMPASMANVSSHARSPSSGTFPTGASLAPPSPSGKASPTTPERPSTPVRKPFPVAELLLQNGADIPTTPAPIPLSTAARQYLDFKTEQRNGRLVVGTSGSVGTSPGRGDGIDSGMMNHTASGAGGRSHPPGSSHHHTTTGSSRDRDEEAKRITGIRKSGGWSNSGFVGGVKALGDVGRRS